MRTEKRELNLVTRKLLMTFKAQSRLIIRLQKIKEYMGHE